MKQNRMGASIAKIMGLFLVVMLLGTNTGRADWFSNQATAAQKTAKKAGAIAKQAGADTKQWTAEQVATAQFNNLSKEDQNHLINNKKDDDYKKNPNYTDRVRILRLCQEWDALDPRLKKILDATMGYKGKFLRLPLKITQNDGFSINFDFAPMDQIRDNAYCLTNQKFGLGAVVARALACDASDFLKEKNTDQVNRQLQSVTSRIRESQQDISGNGLTLSIVVAKDWLALPIEQRINIIQSNRDFDYLDTPNNSRARVQITWDYGLTKVQRNAITEVGKKEAYLNTSTQPQRDAIVNWCTLTQAQRSAITDLDSTAAKVWVTAYLNTSTQQQRDAIANWCILTPTQRTNITDRAAIVDWCILTQTQRNAIANLDSTATTPSPWKTAYLNTSTQPQRDAIVDWCTLTQAQRTNITTAGQKDAYLNATTPQERTALVTQYGTKTTTPTTGTEASVTTGTAATTETGITDAANAGATTTTSITDTSGTTSGATSGITSATETSGAATTASITAN